MVKNKSKNKKSDKYVDNMDHLTYKSIDADKYDGAVSGLGMIKLPEEIFGPKERKTKTLKEIRG